jgi:hypothetical protein
MTSRNPFRDAMNLVAAMVCAMLIVVYWVFVENLVDGRAPTYGINFTEAVGKLAGQ